MEPDAKGAGHAQAVPAAAGGALLAAATGERSLLWHELFLGERLCLVAWIRYLVAASIVAGSWFSTRVVGVEGLDVARLAWAAGIIALYNTAAFVLARRYREPDRAAGARRVLVGMAHAGIAADFAMLTFLLWLVGGPASPFVAFYILHVILASMLLTRKAACAHAALGYALLAGLVVGEWRGWIPPHRPAGAVAGLGTDGRYYVTVLTVQGVLMGLATFLTTGLAQILREGERQLRQANEEMERLSNMRRDFLHVTLHNLKAPVSAVSMLLANMEAGLGGPISEQQAGWLQRCQKRLGELLAFLHELQVLAELDSQRLLDRSEPTDVAPLLESLVAENQDLALAHRHSLKADVPKDLPKVRGIERLLREAAVNYVTNAIKYTPDGGTIVVSASGGGGAVRIEVRDNGIGISAEDQARLFREFVRAGIQGDQVPRVPGSGLGLSIVRRIAEAHGGKTGVISEMGKGSTFYIELPAERG